MTVLKILQDAYLEYYYDQPNDDTNGFTTKDLDNVHTNMCNAFNKFQSTLTPKQLELYEDYANINLIHEQLCLEKEFQRGFKLAVKIMTESMS